MHKLFIIRRMLQFFSCQIVRGGFFFVTDITTFFFLQEQIWRMNDLIYRPEEEVLAELEQFKSHILTCADEK